MNTNKITTLLKEEKVSPFEKKTKLMATICWELAKKCCWPQKTFDEKMNRSMINHIAFLLALEIDPYAGYQNCCNNILEKFMQKENDPGISATERKQQDCIFWMKLFDTTTEINFSKPAFKSALPQALLEMLEEPDEQILFYWRNWFAARNKKREGKLLKTILTALNSCNYNFYSFLL
ncbi:MAG: hypothetical protein ABIP30_16715 [Ferruginibacter sp.]